MIKNNQYVRFILRETSTSDFFSRNSLSLSLSLSLFGHPSRETITNSHHPAGLFIPPFRVERRNVPYPVKTVSVAVVGKPSPLGPYTFRSGESPAMMVVVVVARKRNPPVRKFTLLATVGGDSRWSVDHRLYFRSFLSP